MPKTSSLQVQGRDRAGKGAARATRRGGLVPGVIYGGNQDATLIALEPKVLVSLMHDPAFKTNIFEVEILPEDPEWSSAKLQEIEAALSGPENDGTPSAEQDLRFLATPAAVELAFRHALRYASPSAACVGCLACATAPTPSRLSTAIYPSPMRPSITQGLGLGAPTSRRGSAALAAGGWRQICSRSLMRGRHLDRTLSRVRRARNT